MNFITLRKWIDAKLQIHIICYDLKTLDIPNTNMKIIFRFTVAQVKHR